MPVVTVVNNTKPGVVIAPSNKQTMFSVFLEHIIENDESGNEIYAIHTQGLNFTLKVPFIVSFFIKKREI